MFIFVFMTVELNIKKKSSGQASGGDKRILTLTRIKNRTWLIMTVDKKGSVVHYGVGMARYLREEQEVITHINSNRKRDGTHSTW